MTALGLREVSVAYDGTRVVNELSLSVPAGAWVGLIGPNGAGKSTLLRAIAGLVEHSGEILVGDVPLPALGRRKLSRLVAFVPQKPFTPDPMLVTDYVLMGRTPYISYLGSENRSDLEVVADVLDRLELGSLADRALGSLSGGELQRAVLARALAQQAPILLLDEPTSALDVGHQQHVLELVDALRLAHELTIVTAMHDLTLAGQFAESLLLMSGGRAVASGPPAAVLSEETIRSHYGASVRIIQSANGEIVVAPTRPPRPVPRPEDVAEAVK